MTLKGYYDGLPEPTKPKNDFIMEIVRKCGVRETTVYNWISGRTRPTDAKHIAVLCDVTGLKEEQLWTD